jgi:hypothetical protein
MEGFFVEIIEEVNAGGTLCCLRIDLYDVAKLLETRTEPIAGTTRSLSLQRGSPESIASLITPDSYGAASATQRQVV